MSRRGELTIDFMFIIVVSVIGIVFLLLLFSGKLPAVGKEVYCNTFFHLQSSRFFPEGFRASEGYCVSDERESAVLETVERRPFTLRTIQGGGTTARLIGAGTITLLLPQDARVVSFNVTIIPAADEPVIDIDAGADTIAEDGITSALAGERSSRASALVAQGLNATLASLPKPCPGNECPVPLRFVAQGSFVMSAIEVGYTSCAIPETFIAQLLACDEKSDQGRRSSPVVCGELSVPSTCEGTPLSAADIARLLSAHGLCAQLPMQAQGCGFGSRVDWRVSSIVPGENYLIEHRPETGQIRVS